MKRLHTSQVQKKGRKERIGKLSKHQGGFTLESIVHDFEVVHEDGVVYEISDDIFRRVENFINSQYNDYKN